MQALRMLLLASAASLAAFSAAFSCRHLHVSPAALPSHLSDHSWCCAAARVLQLGGRHLVQSWAE